MHPRAQSAPFHCALDNLSQITALMASLLMLKEALLATTRLTLFSNDKPDRFFTVIKFWMDETSGVALALKTAVPTYPSRRRPAAPKVRLHRPAA